jgi:hypothetical protein
MADGVSARLRVCDIKDIEETLRSTPYSIPYCRPRVDSAASDAPGLCVRTLRGCEIRRKLFALKMAPCAP